MNRLFGVKIHIYISMIVTVGVDRGSAPSDMATPIFCGLCGRGPVLVADVMLVAGKPVQKQ